MPAVPPVPQLALVDLGSRLRRAREAVGLSLHAVADRLGLSHATVGHWETGTNAIKAPELFRLCHLYSVSADDMLFGARRWPFPGVDYDAVQRLEPIDRGRLEGAMLAVAEAMGAAIAARALPAGLVPEPRADAAKDPVAALQSSRAKRSPRARAKTQE